MTTWTCTSASPGSSIEIEGEGADLAGAGEDHLVVRAMRKTFAALGSQPPGLGLRCVNRIPHGRGLGSSAAAIVAGILAARALVSSGAETLPDEALLGLATEMEGHPDNVAACLGGGLTIAWTKDGQPRMARLEPLASISPVVCVGPPRCAPRWPGGCCPAWCRTATRPPTPGAAPCWWPL